MATDYSALFNSYRQQSLKSAKTPLVEVSAVERQ